MGGTQVQGLDWSSDPTSVFITQLSQPWHALSLCYTVSPVQENSEVEGEWSSDPKAGCGMELRQVWLSL